MTQKFDSIIFDLDGTLWDATKAIKIIYNKVLNDRFPEYSRDISIESVRSYMGLPIEEIGRRILPDAPKELSDEYMYICGYEENKYLAEHNGEVFDGVLETLETLSQKYQLLIVSNCLTGYIESFFAANNCKDLFVDYQWNTGQGITKGQLNAMVIKRNCLKNPIYVGDTQGDAISAKKVEMPFVFASYGFGQPEEALCDYKIQDFKQLPCILYN